MTALDIFNGRNEHYFPPQFRYLGYALVVVGGFMLYNLNIFGVGFIIIGPVFFLLKTGIRINFEERSLLEYIGVFRLYFGKWKKLPEIEYVTVYEETVSQVMNVQSIRGGDIDSHFNTDLIFHGPDRLKVICFPQKAEALEAGKLLACKLQTRLLDYTSGEPVWIGIN